MSNYTGIGTGGYSGDSNEEYWRTMYGDATISFVPPVTDYNYADNIGYRGTVDRTFTWTEVTISLDDVPELALIDFLVPDSYVIEITPDIGWSNVLSMFGEDEEIGLNNPHKTTLGPFSIGAGNLTDNADSSVTAILTEAQMLKSVTKGYKKYLWRAVPWADGNPGLGGLPSTFEYVSTSKQALFSIDEIVKETKRPLQIVTGKKSSRVTITTKDENNPDLFIEETAGTWRVQFSIDRPNVRFTITATDSGGVVVGTHQVNIDYESVPHHTGHVWNQTDSFGLFASLSRLPHETNAKLKSRIVDAFQNRGGAHYRGLVTSSNRELGLFRIDNGVLLKRKANNSSYSLETNVLIEVTHTRIGVSAPSFIINDEIKAMDKYDHTVITNKRISSIISIEDNTGTDISPRRYYVTNDVDQNEIQLDHNVNGPIFITYAYIDDIDYATYPLVGDVVAQLNAIELPTGSRLLEATMSEKLSGSESSSKLYHGFFKLSNVTESRYIGWSPLSMFSLSNREYKESFKDSNNLYFNSAFYKYVVELKSNSNIEWGHIVADQDIWDAIETDTYGQDSLELIADVPIADFKLPVSVPTYKGRQSFDPWEAFRMGYYYNDVLIKNLSFSKQLFRSGVGFKKDCRVTISIVNISAEDGVVNQSPIVSNPEDAFDFNESDAADIIVRY